MCYTKNYVTIMHKHIIINQDLGLYLVIYSEDEELDLINATEELITEQLCYAAEGIQKT